MTNSPLIYIAYPMASGGTAVKYEAQKIASCLRTEGYNVFVPDVSVHLSSLRDILPDKLLASIAFQISYALLSEAAGLIAFVNEPSTGVGLEIGVAFSRGLPLVFVALTKEDKVSEMVVGLCINRNCCLQGSLDEHIGISQITRFFKERIKTDE